MKSVSLFGKQIWVKHSVVDASVSDSAVERYANYKISLLLTDGLAAIVEDKIFVGEKYDIFFFRPDEIHFGRFLRAGRHEYVDFYIQEDFFDDIPFGQDLKFFFEDRAKDRVNMIHTEFDDRKTVATIAERLLICLEEFVGEAELFSIALQIILLLSRLYANEKLKETTRNVPPIVSRTLSYIDAHYSEKITVKEIAVKMGCSEAYLSRIFKRHTGVTVYKHVTDVRISEAQGLLDKGLGVTEVCFACGFDDCSNFIATFKKITGLTPLRYKKIGSM